MKYKLIEFTAKYLAITVYPNTSTTYQKYEVYYNEDEAGNTSDDYLEVYRAEDTLGNLVFGAFSQITSASPRLYTGNPNSLNFDSDSNTSSINFGVELTDENYLTTFQVKFSGGFPYVTRFQQELEDGEINDLSVSTIVRPSSAPAVNDGGIYVIASGTNSPFFIALSEFASFIPLTDAQSQYTNSLPVFGTLYTGTYNLIVKDNKGFIRDVEITVPTTDEFPTFTDYGEKYFFTFNSSKYRVNIYQRDFAGSSTELTTFGETPILVSLQQEGSEIYESNVLASTCSIELKSDTLRQWAEFVNADDNEYIFRFYIDGNLSGQWFLLPENIQEDLYQSPYIISLQGTDKLTDLKNYKWQANIVQETDSLWNVIKTVLDSTGMEQGYRVANSLIESGHTNGTTDNPFIETYVNTTTYDGLTYLEVLQRVLQVFHASIRSWNGFWYIIRYEELLSGTSVSYKEYDSSMVYQSASTYNPVVEFKSASSTSRWRWAGRQSQTYEPQFNKINLNLLLDKNDEGLGYLFKRGEWSQKSNTFGSFIWQNNTVRMQVSRGNSQNYIERTGSFKHKTSDFLKLQFDIETRLIDNQPNAFDPSKSLEFRGPYFPLKWSLKVGSKWLDTSGNWNDTESINQYFINDINERKSFNVYKRLYGSNNASQNYVLRIYAASIFEKDLSYESIANLLTGVRAVSTSSLNAGARLIIGVGAFDAAGIISASQTLYYYELQNDDSAQDDISRIKPTDSSTLHWVLISQWYYDHSQFGADALYGAVTETELSDFRFDLYPNNSEPPEEVTLTKNGTDKNRRELDIDFYHHDLLDISSGDTIYLNYLKLSDDTPTSSWTYSTVTDTIQGHFGRQMVQLYKNTRGRILGGQVSSDLDITPINILKSNSDDNRLYVLNGVTFNYKDQFYEGDFIEYINDNTTIVRDFDSGDFDTSDFK